MSRKIFVVGMLALVLTFGVMFTGCVSTQAVVFDENIPVDQQAIFLVPGGYWDVVEFSGRTVKWYSLSILGSTTVTIPSGEHTVKFNYYNDANNHFRNKELTAVFEAGHKYRLREQESGRTIYFGIYDETSGKYVTPMP